VAIIKKKQCKYVRRGVGEEWEEEEGARARTRGEGRRGGGNTTHNMK